MILIVGLGNPKSQYKYTYHNLGFEVINSFVKENDFPEFTELKKCNSLISEKENVILAKPLTFMNNSGVSVKCLMKKYNPKLLIVIHDEIDLIIGSVQKSENKSSAGHKGVQSIITELGTQDFTRIRIGIQPEFGKPESVEDFVLKKYREGKLDDVITESISTIKQILSQRKEG